MRDWVVYSNGGFTVVPIVTGFLVKGLGREIGRFSPLEIEQAVSEADTLAEQTGCYAAVA